MKRGRKMKKKRVKLCSVEVKLSLVPVTIIQAVGPMAGVVSPSMPVWIIKDKDIWSSDLLHF
ncbi:MAG: DUF1116 domain-containing protein [Bacillota bacterium]